MNSIMIELSLVLGIIIAAIVLVLILCKISKKTGKPIGVKIGKGDTHVDVSFGKGEEDSDLESSKPSISKNGVKRCSIDFTPILQHRFFTSTLHRYTTETCTFTLYNTMCERGVKKENAELREFKKIIASKYLHKCLFQYICDSIKQWVTAVIAECDANEYTINDKKPPTSYYNCIEEILNYQEKTKKLAREIVFEFKGHTIRGIPEPFINTFNDWSIKNVETIQRLLQDTIYSNDENSSWFMKMIEILDMFEMIFKYIQCDVDATLVILNGEMERYVDNLLKAENQN